MRISFDLDDTLICYQKEVPCEPSRLPGFMQSWWKEPLRQGTRALITELQKQGCQICICTSSYRSPLMVRLWLAAYGIRVRQVINQDVYEARLRRFSESNPPSKNPRLFGIDLHIDDSEGVRIEGDRYGFDVLVVSPDDLDWTQRIVEAVYKRRKR